MSAHRLSDDVRDQIRSWCRRGLIKYLYTDYSGDILWAEDRWGGEIDFLIDLNVPFHVDTNGVHLTEERGIRLLNSKMTWLNVSLDAANSETYKRIRRGSAPLEFVLKNVADFSRLRFMENVKRRVTLSLGFTLMRSNLDQLNDFIEIGSRLGVDMIACRHLEAYTPDMAEESLWFDKDRFNEARLASIDLATKRGLTLAIGEPLEERPSRAGHRFCPVPWMSAVILGNGDVQVCCVPKTKIGNLREQTMEKLWAGDAYAAFRTAVNSDKPPACCNACAYSRRPGNVESYLPFQTINQWVPPYEWKV
jgi:radical SAM protein with 4Fe4S-binding SPASM domain